MFQFSVACSTVTVTKCQAALRTLQAFPFFRPTCLCKEPGIDPDCNYFRDFLFDHPCGFVLKKGKSFSFRFPLLTIYMQYACKTIKKNDFYIYCTLEVKEKLNNSAVNLKL